MRLPIHPQIQLKGIMEIGIVGLILLIIVVIVLLRVL